MHGHVSTGSSFGWLPLWGWVGGLMGCSLFFRAKVGNFFGGWGGYWLLAGFVV